MMNAHVVARAFDSERPASLSARIATGSAARRAGISRRALYRLSRNGRARGIGRRDVAVAALAAGVDMLVFSHRRRSRAPRGRGDRRSRSGGRALARAFGRGARAVHEACARPEAAPIAARVSFHRIPHLGREIARRAITLVRGAGARRSDRLDRRIVRRRDRAGARGARALSPRRAIVGSHGGRSGAALRRAGPARTPPAGPRRAARTSIRRKPRRSREFSRRYPDATVVSLREPFDLPLFGAARHLLAAYGDDIGIVGRPSRRALQRSHAGGSPSDREFAARCRGLNGSKAFCAAGAASILPPPLPESNIAGRSFSNAPTARRATTPRRATSTSTRSSISPRSPNSSSQRSSLQLVAQHRLDARRAVGPPASGVAATARTRQITLRMLLAHTSGMNSGADYRAILNENVERFCAARSALIADARRARVYSDLGFIALGVVLERAAGASLAARWRARSRRRWRSRPDAARRAAIPGDRRRRVARDAFRASCTTRKRYLMGGVAGHAGLFGTASDVAALTESYLGAMHGRSGSLLPPSLAREAIAEQAYDPVLRRGLGWALKTTDENSCGRLMDVRRLVTPASSEPAFGPIRCAICRRAADQRGVFRARRTLRADSARGVLRSDGRVGARLMLAVGLMSGTSLDGVDAALVSAAPCGESILARTAAFPKHSFERRFARGAARRSPPNDGSVAALARLHRELGGAFGRAA